MSFYLTPELMAQLDREADEERRRAEERTARLAELYGKPALGHYRQGHLPPPYPADAPPLPPPARTDWTPAGLVVVARDMAARNVERQTAAEVIVAMGRRSGLAYADITTALRELVR